ncbi:hypothetical protein [Sutterella wadsworthensis]
MKNITIGRRSFFLGAVAAAVSSALPATAGLFGTSRVFRDAGSHR